MATSSDPAAEPQDLIDLVRYIQSFLSASENPFTGSERLLRQLGALECRGYFEMIPGDYRVHPDRMPRHPLNRDDYIRIFLANYTAERVDSMRRELASAQS